MVTESLTRVAPGRHLSGKMKTPPRISTGIAGLDNNLMDGLLNEFLKQHHKVEEQSAQIDQLKRRLESLEKALLSQKGN
jgi:hypothetical protein